MSAYSVTFFYLLLERCFSTKSEHVVFLKLHQKAELTCVQFNRTFTFVLTAKSRFVPDAFRFEDKLSVALSGSARHENH